MVPPSRRRLLAGLGGAGAVGFAGCLDSIPRFPKRIHNRDAVIQPMTDGWRSKHGGPARRSTAASSLPTAATATPVLVVDHWWKGQPVFGPDRVLLPVQLPSREEAGELSFEGLLALDPRTGAERWRFAYDKPFATPTVVGETIFVQGATTYALDRTDGSVYWEYRSGYGHAGTAPAFVDGVVAMFASRSRTVVGLDARTGEQLWSTRLVSKYPMGIASGVNGIYASVPGDEDSAGELVRIDPSSGEFEWRRELHGHVSTPVVGTDRVYLWVDLRLVAFDKSSGDREWTAPIQTSSHWNPNVAVDGDVCVTLAQKGQKPAVVALDPTSGDQRWRGPHTPTVEFSPLAMTEEYVYTPLEGCEVGALERSNGSIAERWEVPGRPVTGVTIDRGTGVLVTRDEGSESIALLRR